MRFELGVEIPSLRTKNIIKNFIYENTILQFSLVLRVDTEELPLMSAPDILFIHSKGEKTTFFYQMHSEPGSSNIFLEEKNVNH